MMCASDHGVAAHAQDVRVRAGVDDVRHGDRLAGVLVGLDGTTGGDLAEDGEAAGGHVRAPGQDVRSGARGEQRGGPQPKSPGLRRVTLQQAVLLERGEVVVDGRRGRQTDGRRDLPHRGRIAAPADRTRRCTR